MGVAVAAAIVEEASNGTRLLRQAAPAAKLTVNIVAPRGNTAAAPTLVVLAHHDAAPTGRVYDPTFSDGWREGSRS